MNLQNDLKEILRTNENLYKSLNQHKKSIEQEKILVSLEIDPSKRLADVNQDDNFFETAE